MTSFKDSQEAAYRRLMRDAVRKGCFSKSERDTVLAVLNHWFHYKAKGRMFPGRTKIAKKAGVSEKTVQRVFALLRDNGVLEPLSELKLGRGRATEYRLDEVALLHLCGSDIEQIVASLGRVKWDKKRDKPTPLDASESGTPCPTVYRDITTDLSHGMSNVIAFPLRKGAA